MVKWLNTSRTAFTFQTGCVKVIKNIEFDFDVAEELPFPEYKVPRRLKALVLTPTRELAIQVKNHIVAVAKYTDIKVNVNSDRIQFMLSLQLWARLIGEAISISTQNWDRDFLTSQLILTLWDRSRWPSQFFPKCRDRSRWPSQSFKIFEVSWEKSGFTWLIPTLPNFSRFFWPKKAGKNWGKLGIGHPDTTQILGRVGLPYKIPIPICQKDKMAILISISTLPDFCRDIIPLEISRP